MLKISAKVLCWQILTDRSSSISASSNVSDRLPRTVGSKQYCWWRFGIPISVKLNCRWGMQHPSCMKILKLLQVLLSSSSKESRKNWRADGSKTTKSSNWNMISTRLSRSFKPWPRASTRKSPNRLLFKRGLITLKETWTWYIRTVCNILRCKERVLLSNGILCLLQFLERLAIKMKIVDNIFRI